RTSACRISAWPSSHRFRLSLQGRSPALHARLTLHLGAPSCHEITPHPRKLFGLEFWTFRSGACNGGLGVGRVEVGLEVIESMEVPSLGLSIVGPGGLLHARKNHAAMGARWFLLRPDVPIALFGMRVLARLLEPLVFVW